MTVLGFGGRYVDYVTGKHFLTVKYWRYTEILTWLQVPREKQSVSVLFYERPVVSSTAYEGAG